MANAKNRKLKLGDDLPPHLLKRLQRTMEEHRADVLANQHPFPDPDDPAVEHCDTPGDFVHPTARPVRKPSKSRLRGAQKPRSGN